MGNFFRISDTATHQVYGIPIEEYIILDIPSVNIDIYRIIERVVVRSVDCLRNIMFVYITIIIVFFVY